MARYTGPQYKKLKRLGMLPEAEVVTTVKSGPPHKRKSTYGLRIDEKQKLKFTYGILEKQFRRLFDRARRDPLNTGTVLMQLLERRLDNVVYRLGFAKTRSSARQLVNHGHVLVNNKRLDIPSYNVKVQDLITLKPKTQSNAQVTALMDEAKLSDLPSWLDRKGFVGVVKSIPAEDDVQTDVDLQLIIEYYSR